MEKVESNKVESRENKPVKCVEDLLVYQKAKQLFNEFISEDLPLLEKSFVGQTLARNQLRCLDSICANMEEGFERKFGKEVKNFFRISKGSAAEALGRYKRLKSQLPDNLLGKRLVMLGEIRAMLHSLISKWQ